MEQFPLLVLAVVAIGSLAIVSPFVCLTIWRPTRHVRTSKEQLPRVVVLVLGDIGRSPRMQNHALSIARNGGKVDLVGYNDSKCSSEILNSPNITIHGLRAPPRFLTTSIKLFFPIFAPIKIIFQLVVLLRLLLYTLPSEVSHILVQNPPSMPTFLVAILTARLRGLKFVIDWHNFGWSILALKLGAGAPIVAFAKLYEKWFGRFADTNFTVTHAMKKVLTRELGIAAPVHVLHDRPPQQFQPLSKEARESVLRRIPETACHVDDILSGKMRLLTSSTSWTPDEDFQILLDAFIEYDREVSLSTFITSGQEAYPDILAVITGKGPLKAAYEAQLERIDFNSIRIKMAWLEQDDYPKFVAAADLGVCLHTSSSGVDLPMKVVDLFGGGVPVLAVGFKAIGELVKEGENGKIFGDAKELAKCLMTVFGKQGKELERLRMGAMKETEDRWEERWDHIARTALGF